MFCFDCFIYLGSILSKDGGSDDHVKSRINKARHAFNTLRPIWNSKEFSLRNKTRIFNTNVKAVLLDGSETWRVTNGTANKLQALVNRCLRHILNIRWPEISNAGLWERTSQNPISLDVRKRKWGWIGQGKLWTGTHREKEKWGGQNRPREDQLRVRQRQPD